MISTKLEGYSSHRSPVAPVQLRADLRNDQKPPPEKWYSHIWDKFVTFLWHYWGTCLGSVWIDWISFWNMCVTCFGILFDQFSASLATLCDLIANWFGTCLEDNFFIYFFCVFLYKLNRFYIAFCSLYIYIYICI